MLIAIALSCYLNREWWKCLNTLEFDHLWRYAFAVVLIPFGLISNGQSMLKIASICWRLNPYIMISLAITLVSYLVLWQSSSSGFVSSWVNTFAGALLIFTMSCSQSYYNLPMVTLACFLIHKWWQSYIFPWNSRFPCIGPTIPILGNLLSLNFSNVIMELDGLHQKHGDSFVVWVLWRPVVVTRDGGLFEKVSKSTHCDYLGKGIRSCILCFHQRAVFLNRIILLQEINESRN